MKPKQVKSAFRAVNILEVISDSSKGMRASEISDATGFPKSCVHEILSTLHTSRYLIKDEDTQRYKLSIRMISMGEKARANMDVRKTAEPYLKILNQKFNETVQLLVLYRGDTCVIECIESTENLRSHNAVGTVMPAHVTSAGKVLFAYSPKEDQQAIVRRCERSKKLTANTITTEKEFYEELEKIREQGFAVGNMEYDENIRCVAAPVFDYNGEAVASVSITAPVLRMPEERITEYAEEVMKTAAEISADMGFED